MLHHRQEGRLAGAEAGKSAAGLCRAPGLPDLTPSPGMDAQECVSIAGLTRLTSLRLCLEQDHLPDGRHAAAELTALRRLAELTLIGSHLSPASLTVEDLDLASPPQLTCLALKRVEGGLSAACRMAALRKLDLQDMDAPVDEQDVRGMTALTRLECFTFDCPVFIDAIGMLEQLPSLRKLGYKALNSTFQDDPDGSWVFLDILQCLTALTSLELEYCKYASASRLQHDRQIGGVCLHP